MNNFFLRAKHYTQQLLCVVGFICENLNKNIPAVAIFFDVAKAFAKIWHEGFIYKLIQLGIHAWLIHSIQSYVNGCNCCVHIKNIISIQFMRVSYRVLCWYPKFVNISFNNILWTLMAFVALYADNTAIYPSAHYSYYLYKKFSKHGDIFIRWCFPRVVEINESKTAAIHFYKNFIYPNPITINNATILWTNHTKYHLW